MAVILEVKAGPFAGKQIALASGQSVVIGRAAANAQFPVPHDTFMSSAHFAVECGPKGCRVLDKKSSNGTFLNGARIQEAMLANGDEIKSGQTIFVVKVVADDKLPAAAPLPAAPTPPKAPKPAPVAAAPQPAPSSPGPAAAPQPPAPVMRAVDQGREAGGTGRAASGSPPLVSLPSSAPVSVPPAAAIPKPVVPPASRVAEKSLTPAFCVMGWSFYALPEQWQVQEGFGLQRTVNDEFPSSVAATQEHLGGMSLQQFVESQISMLRQYLRNPKIEPTMPPQVAGAEETMAVDVRHLTKDGKELIYRRIYARSGPSVGVLTVTALATELPQVLQTLQGLLDSAAFRSTVIS